MKQSEDTIRDRAFMQQIRVQEQDRERFMEFLYTIPRKNFINQVKNDSITHFLVYAKLKEQELMYIQLSFKVAVKKMKTRKKAVKKAAEMFKSNSFTL